MWKQLIHELQLLKHPEGGYYRETYRSTVRVEKEALPDSFKGARNICTSIYFLLPSEECSRFHRIKSDEIWHYHSGSSLSIYVLNEGRLDIYKLGPQQYGGEAFQVVIPANSWFGARCNATDSFTLAGCTVSPGFDFVDFEMAKRSHLLQSYPQFEKEILMLTATI
jgi:uncharacterized protein